MLSVLTLGDTSRLHKTARRNLGFRRAVLGENRRGNAGSGLPLLTRRATGGGVTPL